MFVLTFLPFYFLPLLSVMIFMGKPDEHRTQHGEDVCLNKGHQHLKCIHEEQHDDTESIQTKTKSDTHRPTEEDHAGETQNHSVASHHVGKETDHQREGFREYSEEFDDRHHRNRIGLQEQRNLWPEDLLPVLLVGKDVDGEHRTDCQEEGDIDITRHIRSTREDGDQSDEVTCHLIRSS